MTWTKLGRIFHLEDALDRSNHTQVPTPFIMEDRVRVYYACRSNGMSFPAFIDLDRNDLTKVIRVQEKPIMPLGDPGMFDSDGIMPSCIIPSGNELMMYYTGWNEKSKTARYHNAIGAAVSRDGGEAFLRAYDGPVMDRRHDFSGISVTPFIMQDGGIYRMWYIAGVSWNRFRDKYEPVYVIKYADSRNGYEWDRYQLQCVPSKNKLEAFSNPCVIKKNDKYHMWYCYRDSLDYRGGNGSYRIGYSSSTYGAGFERRDDECGLELGAEGEWDSTMQCYPYVIELDGKMYMFYNGNDFGQTGIGLAVWGGNDLS